MERKNKLTNFRFSLAVKIENYERGQGECEEVVELGEMSRAKSV